MHDTTLQKYRQMFHSKLVEGALFVGKYDFPMLEPVSFQPAKAVPFHRRKGADRQQWVHFYTDDYRFECLWNCPDRYLEQLRAFAGVITPDFSVFTFLPEALQIYNTYRNRALGYWLQKNGVPIVPNVRWGLEESYDYCFDGIPKGSTVAVSTNGCLRTKENRAWFQQGFREMVRRLEPAAIVNYGSLSKGLFDPAYARGIPITCIPHFLNTLEKGGEH